MEDSDNEELDIHGKAIKRLAPWQFQKGKSGNPAGRWGGKSMKEFAKEYLANLSEEDRFEFFKGMNKDTVWKMAEGNPHNTSDVKVELPPIPIDDLKKDA